jgi:hypothetical protein
MTAAFERVLQLVADGKLTAEEAAPILEALEPRSTASSGAQAGGASGRGGPRTPEAPLPPEPPEPSFAFGGPADPPGNDLGRPPRFARVEVRERGRRVVDLRIPISLGRFALARVPGLSAQQVADVEEAVTSGAHGPILDVQDPDGDGVRIVLE